MWQKSIKLMYVRDVSCNRNSARWIINQCFFLILERLEANSGQFGPPGGDFRPGTEELVEESWWGAALK